MYNYDGITTNNLKNISINFNDNELIYIGGCSGSGKSSLAFDTIAAISENEYGTLINDNKVSVKYRIKFYGDVLVVASLKQLNFNLNPRSTILTYFGLYTHLSNIFSHYTALSADNFSLNGPCRCKDCNGTGYIKKIDELLVVNPEKKIKDGPFKCWTSSYSDFFSQLLHNFCVDNEIDENKKFCELNKEIQNLLLYSKGKKKYKILFSANGRKRTKTSEYIGPITGLELENTNPFCLNSDKYSRLHICPACKGSRLIDSINHTSISNDSTVADFLTSPMKVVAHLIQNIKTNSNQSNIDLSCDYILRFIQVCKKLNITYLNFSRGISTLSGGELQKLRIAQILLGKLKNLLIVLDEPTASLSQEETDSIINIIKELKTTNTVIVVDHNDKLREISDRSYFLGPKSGINGGNLIKLEDYIKMQSIPDIKPISKPADNKKITVSLNTEYVVYSNELILYENSLNGICGLSGIGKTTILKDILPYQLTGYKYISQKPIKANSFSNIATYTDVLEDVKNYYSKNTEKKKGIFSLSQEGACPKCSGKGCLDIDNFYDKKLFIECDKCGGTGYAKLPLACKVNGLNIYDFLNQNIDQIIESNIFVSKKFCDTLQLLRKLGLGHLALNQKVSSLSGGENQRLKLSQALKDSKYKCYGLDEPAKGLGKKEIIDLISIIYENIEKYNKTFIVVEHNQIFLNLCQYNNELVRENGMVKIQEFTK